MVVFNDSSYELAIRIFHKITDKNSYISYQFFHPKGIRYNIPLEQSMRIKRNCILEGDFQVEASLLTDLGVTHLKLFNHLIKKF